MVVPGSKRTKRGIQGLAIRYDPLVELLLERAEEAFDAAVLPRTVQFGGLMTDAKPSEKTGVSVHFPWGVGFLGLPIFAGSAWHDNCASMAARKYSML